MDLPRPAWWEADLEEREFRSEKMKRDPKDVCAPCVDIAAISPSNDSARSSTTWDSEPDLADLAVEPAVLGLPSAESESSDGSDIDKSGPS
jgi:hypothetical protein